MTSLQDLADAVGVLPPAVATVVVVVVVFRRDLLRIGSAVLGAMESHDQAERRERQQARKLEADERAAGVDAIAREASAFREAILADVAALRAELLERAQAEAACEERVAALRAELERVLGELAVVRERLAVVEAELADANAALGRRVG